MFSLLLKYLLKRALPVPLAWSMIYPSILGDLVIRNGRLGEPALVQVDKSVISPEWSSIFDDVVQVKTAKLFGVHAKIDTSEPLTLIHCLQGKPQCGKLPTNISAAGRPLAQKREVESAPATEQYPPLALSIKKVESSSGQIRVLGSGGEISLQIVSFVAENVSLPLEDEDVIVNADVLLQPQGTTPDGGIEEAVPIRIKLHWENLNQILSIDALSNELPLATLSKVLPDLFPAGSANSGSLSGTLSLEYHAKTKAWRLAGGI